MEYFEDGINVRTNSVTITGAACGPSYNAVLSVSFSDEDDTEPVTLQEAKDWCRIDVTDDDTLITALIKAARIMCENYANLSFINRTITAKIRNGLGDFNAPFGPVKEITSATDSENIAIDDFDFDNYYSGKVIVVYTAGPGDTLAENLRTALLNQIAFLYENRGDARLQTGLSLESKLILNQVRNV